MDENRIIPYIEPIFRFCYKRLNDRHDAEDLSSEIICYILDGMKKYEIKSFDAWVWRIAHNRYARFIDMQNRSQVILSEDDTLFSVVDHDYCCVDDESTEREFTFTPFLPSIGIFSSTTILEKCQYVRCLRNIPSQTLPSNGV